MLPLLLACHPQSPPHPHRDGGGGDDTTTAGAHSASTATTGTTDSAGTTSTGGEPLLVFDGPRPTNLLMISIDTTRRDLFGDAVSPPYQPFLAARMQEGVVLDDHQSCANYTYAATTCTLLGRYHEESPFYPIMWNPDRAPFPDGTPFLAVRMRDQGYHTILRSANEWLGDQWNTHQGYVEYAHTGVNAAASLSAGRSQVEAATAAGAARWFLHVHLMEPHAPYTPPERFYADELVGVDPMPPLWNLDTIDGHQATVAAWPLMSPANQALLVTYLRARYHGELRSVDEQIGQEWDAFDATGLLDDTLVVVWTDHGEQIFERGAGGHALNLNAEENDAAVFFWAKNLRAARWAGPTSAIDVVPTVLQALDLPFRAPEITGAVAGTAPPDRTRYASAWGKNGTAQHVTKGGRKLLFDWATGAVTAYDRTTDRAEAVDTFDATSPTDLGLWNALLPWTRTLDGQLPSQSPSWPAGLPQ